MGVWAKNGIANLVNLPPGKLGGILRCSYEN